MATSRCGVQSPPELERLGKACGVTFIQDVELPEQQMIVVYTMSVCIRQAL